MNDDRLLKGKSDFIEKGREDQVLGIQGLFANPETDVFSLNKAGLNKVCSPPYSTLAGLWILIDCETYRGVSAQPFSGMCSPTEAQQQ